MILKTYTRVFTHDSDAALPLYRQLVGHEPDFNVAAGSLHVVAIGTFLIIAGTDEAMAPIRSSIGTIVVDNLEETQRFLENADAVITQPCKRPFASDSPALVVNGFGPARDACQGRKSRKRADTAGSSSPSQSPLYLPRFVSFSQSLRVRENLSRWNLQPITQGPTGASVHARHPDGNTFEYVQWKPEFVERIIT